MQRLRRRKPLIYLKRITFLQSPEWLGTQRRAQPRRPQRARPPIPTAAGRGAGPTRTALGGHAPNQETTARTLSLDFEPSPFASFSFRWHPRHPSSQPSPCPGLPSSHLHAWGIDRRPGGSAPGPSAPAAPGRGGNYNSHHAPRPPPASPASSRSSSPSAGLPGGAEALSFLICGPAGREGSRSLRAYPEEALRAVAAARLRRVVPPRPRQRTAQGGRRCDPTRREDGHPRVHRVLLGLRGGEHGWDPQRAGVGVARVGARVRVPRAERGARPRVSVRSTSGRANPRPQVIDPFAPGQ